MGDDGHAVERLSLEELIVEEYLVFLEGEAQSINWAWSALNDLIQGLPERGWPLLQKIIRRAPDQALDYLGAGPLEDLLRYHGAEVIEAVEREAERSPKLRLALGGLYLHAIQESVRQRVIALVPDGADAALLALVPRRPRSIRIDVIGQPPTRPGSRGAEQVARREALLDAFVAAKGEGFVPWTTPARMEVDIRSRRDSDQKASAGDVLQAVIESLAIDRPRWLVHAGREPLGLVAARSLIQRGEVRHHNSRDASYLVWAYRMHESELRAGR